MDASSGIALAALLFSIFVWWRSRAGIKGERQAREREDKRRDEELGLLREQVELKAEDRLRERRAELVCRQKGHGGEQPGIDYYEVILHNAGRATARDIQACIATEAGDPLSSLQRLTPITRDEDSAQFKLLISIDESRNRERPLFVRVSWADGAGEHAENLEELAAF
jgi:hypothetical protein